MDDSMLSGSATIRASDQQVSSDLSGETVILNLEDGVYYGLNSVGTHIWTLLQEDRSVEELHRQLVKTYDISPEQCMEYLLALLEELHERQLIVVENGQDE
jgi:hypothetical protein